MVSEKNMFYEIAKQLNRIFQDVDSYKSIFGIDKKQAEKELNLYSQMKEKAVVGDKSASDYIIGQFARLLNTDVFNLKESSLNKIINFEDILQNDVQIIFEMLLSMIDMSEIILKYDLCIKITEKDIRQIAASEIENINIKFNNRLAQLRLLATLSYAEEYGQGCIDTLQHQNINEIGIIDKDYIYIVFQGCKIYLEFLKFKDTNVILNIQKKTTQNSVINYDEQNPTLIASKINSSRITVAGFDSTPSSEELYYNERIFNLKKITLEEMRDTYNTINSLIFDYLLLNQKGRGSHFITGADMGVGKSTFLLAMMEKIPDYWGIGILDTQNELQARKKYPQKNIKTLISNSKRSVSESFVTMLKMARDIIYVGEITTPFEVEELINASLRLNAGVGATMHSTSPFEVITNIRNLMMRTAMYNRSEIAEADAARGLDIIIHLAKLPNGRIVVENIVEVVCLNESDNVDILFDGKNSEKIANILNLVQIALKKYLNAQTYRYNEIFRYDTSSDDWSLLNLPTEQYWYKIAKFVERKEIDQFKEHFLDMKNKLHKMEVS